MDGMLEIGLSIVTTSATSVIGYLVYRLKKHEEAKEIEEHQQHQIALETERKRQAEYNAICEMLIALGHDRILQGYRYYKKQNGVSAQDLETMTKLYEAYHALGGNGAVTAIYENIKKLPIKGD